MADETSKTGVFLDADGKVVHSQPTEGIQLVAPGGVIDADAQRAIDAAQASQQAQAETPEPAAKTVTTKTVK